MIATIIASIIVSVILAFLAWDRYVESRKLSEDVRRQQETNLELLKRVPEMNGGRDGESRPLTVGTIAEAVRMEGFVPEVEETGVRFKSQGETFYVDAERLPLFFLLKGYNLDPEDWEMDLLRDAAHRMSDELIMVKATISDDDSSLNFFIAAQDRNFESFRANLTYYLRILEDGQRKLDEEYRRMVEEKREAALAAAAPVLPSKQQENKILS